MLNVTSYRGKIGNVSIYTYFDNLNLNNYCKDVLNPILSIGIVQCVVIIVLMCISGNWGCFSVTKDEVSNESNGENYNQNQQNQYQNPYAIQGYPNQNPYPNQPQIQQQPFNADQKINQPNDSNTPFDVNENNSVDKNNE